MRLLAAIALVVLAGCSHLPKCDEPIAAGWAISISPSVSRVYVDAPLEVQLANLRCEVKVTYVQP